MIQAERRGGVLRAPQRPFLPLNRVGSRFLRRQEEKNPALLIEVPAMDKESALQMGDANLAVNLCPLSDDAFSAPPEQTRRPKLDDA